MDNNSLLDMIKDPNGQPELLRRRLIPENIDVPIAVEIADSQTKMMTLIYCATIYNKLDMVRVLIEAKADVNLGCIDLNVTPLIAAAGNKFLDIAELLLKKKAAQNLVDIQTEQTALMYSLQPKNNIRMIRLLLNHNSPVNHVDIHGRTELAIAVLSHFKDVEYCINIMNILIENKADIAQNGQLVLFCAIKLGSIDIIRFILEQEGIDVNYRGDYGSALDFAIQNGSSIDIVKLLLEAGADHKSLKTLKNPHIAELYKNRQRDFTLAKAIRLRKKAHQKNESAQSILANEHIPPPYVLPYPTTLAQKLFRSRTKQKKRVITGHAVAVMNDDLIRSVRELLD